MYIKYVNIFLRQSLIKNTNNKQLWRVHGNKKTQIRFVLLKFKKMTFV